VIEYLVTEIKKRQQEIATGALLCPKKDSNMVFEYGHICGRYTGLQDVLKIIDDLTREDDDE
jgi:hypothetical protein